MADPAEKERLARLEARIAAIKKTQEPAPRTPDHHAQAQLAWRMVIELVAGLAIGFGIGLGLDALFETRPVFLVLFTLLGFVAGVRTMMRSAREVQDKDAAAQSAAEDGD